jgi:hypothetical protein
MTTPFGKTSRNLSLRGELPSLRLKLHKHNRCIVLALTGIVAAVFQYLAWMHPHIAK